MRWTEQAAAAFLVSILFVVSILVMGCEPETLEPDSAPVAPTAARVRTPTPVPTAQGPVAEIYFKGGVRSLDVSAQVFLRDGYFVDSYHFDLNVAAGTSAWSLCSTEALFGGEVGGDFGCDGIDVRHSEIDTVSAEMMVSSLHTDERPLRGFLSCERKSTTPRLSTFECVLR